MQIVSLALIYDFKIDFFTGPYFEQKHFTMFLIVKAQVIYNIAGLKLDQYIWK